VAEPDARLPAAPRPRGTLLTVLYSANLLGEYEAHPLGGLARRASFAEATRQSSDGLVQVDAGDALLPPLVPIGGKDPDPREVERRARLLATGLGRLHLDAITPGETDLALGLGRLKRIAHGLPLVASNLIDRGGRPLFAADRLVTAAGVRVGIFGLVGATAADAARWEKDGVRIEPLEETARKEVEGLRKRGAAVVVGLFHLPEGPAQARRIGAAAGVDVVILGHDAHAEMVGGAPAAATAPGHGDGGADAGRQGADAGAEGGPPVLEAHHHGTDVGRLDLHVVDGDASRFADVDTGATGSWRRAELVPLGLSVPPEPAIRALVRTYVAESRRRLDQKLPTGLSPKPGFPAGAGDAPAELWQYGSNGACAMCHEKVVEQWKGTPHAAAVDTLEGRGRQRDVYCLGCHSTGFFRPGGTRNLETATTFFADVGCESCHGPSVTHVRTQRPKETRRKVPEAVCRECHRPDQSTEPFDYTAALGLILGPNHGRPGAAKR
jgi:2',3'-cyclic-nucleotide 2'-phosphodiesterase (5'-nucleotidase family)